MLKIVKLEQKSPTVDCLLKLWRKRYSFDFSSVNLSANPFFYQELVEAASLPGRALTSNKLREQIIRPRCEFAGIKAVKFYADLPSVVTLTEVRKLTELSCQIYLKLLEIYQQSWLIPTSEMERFLALAVDSHAVFFSEWVIPPVEELATVLEPFLLKFQAQHLVSKDWHIIGFLTTQLNFTNNLLLKLITIPEQILLKPYFQFIEEQVALPWQRICAAAVNYLPENPVFKLVEQMLPVSQEIAQTAYERLIQIFPNYCTRSGLLSHSDLAEPSLRDLNMWQSYLWLCVLENSTIAIKKELLPLCAIVLPTLKIEWDLIEQWLKLLTDEILARVTSSQKLIVLPYLQEMQQIFFEESFIARPHHTLIQQRP
jgi:hypothetical protein